MSTTTTTANGSSGGGVGGSGAGTGPPPLPATKPVLSSPGSYMANYNPATAGIHSVNKQYTEKPAIAARPVPPPTLPKYTSSFGKIDRADREKLQSKREMFFKAEAHNPSSIINNHSNSNNNTTTSATTTTANHAILTNNNHSNHTNSSNTSITQITTSGSGSAGGNPVIEKLEKTVPSSAPTATNGHISNGGTQQASAAVVTGNVNQLAQQLSGMKMAANKIETTNGHHHPVMDSNKLAMGDRPEKADGEKVQQNQQPVVRAKPKELDGYVGFANLPNQVYRKAVKRGFDFTLMVVGESGLGKSTLINSMFLADVYNEDQHPGPSHRAKKTVAVETTRVLLKENGVNLTLTVVDTPGFGDAVDNSNCWVPVIDFVESKYEEYLTAESRVHRKAMSDSRVHCCIYFIAPSGHGLKPLDVEFMQRLCDKVNIIPVIAKADTMTPEEVILFKKQILNEIAQHKIKIYDFPEPLDNEEEAKVMRQLRSRVPFAVVGANTVIEVEGKKVRGRRYPWGVAEVENLAHCDFIALRNMVIRTHLHDLKDVTNNVHYENYRCRKLAGLGNDGKGRSSNKNPLAQMEEEKKEHELKMKKMEAEMEQVFEMKVKEKKQKLKDSELEMSRRHEERKKQLEVQIREMEDRRRAFEQEKKDWEEQNGVTLDELKRRSLEANSKEAVDGKEKKDKKKKGLF